MASLYIYFDPISFILVSIFLTIIGTWILYVIIFYVFKVTFRKFERDIALVTLNVSAYPALTLFILINLKSTVNRLSNDYPLMWLHKMLIAGIIIAASYWILQLFNQVLIYYFKEYAERTEAMWDEVLVPLLESSLPPIIFLITISLILQFVGGVDMTGIWVTVGGATFVIGLAVKDILANFFSGIALLTDNPLQFGDVISLEDGSLGIIKKIGVRVTEVYMFNSHSNLYIPNSVLQNQKINNLSRPIEPVYYSTPLVVPPGWDLEKCRKILQNIIQAHPDILGDIQNKLSSLKEYGHWPDIGDSFLLKKDNGEQRLLAEDKVNMKLDEIEQSLEALVVTLEFAEKGGLNEEDIKTVQEEYFDVLLLMGFEVKLEVKSSKNEMFSLKTQKNRFEIIESREEDTLINLVREWYHTWLKDPNLEDEDRYLLPELWEEKIEKLQNRIKSLLQKILNPDHVETRLDDYVNNLIKWLRTRFKQTRSQCQIPKVWMEKLFYQGTGYYIQFNLHYYVDDIRLENCRRGERVNSEIHREILRHFHLNFPFDKTR